MQFDASVSYDVALQELTNLGFQPAAYCGFRSDVDAGWVITSGVWKPAGQRDVFAGDQRIFASDTPAADPNATQALKAFPGFQSFDFSQTRYCYVNDGSVATPTSGPAVLASLPSNSLPDLYTQVTFSARVEYAQALYEISDLGLRLADPCYEEALAFHPAPTWHPMSQRGAFSTSQRLVVAPAARISSTTWTDQLRALTDVRSVTTPYSPSC